MTNRISYLILLVEDSTHEALLRGFLKKAGFDLSRLRVRKVNHGAGDQHVRERYAAEVRALRQQLNRTKACLLVMIDADVLTTTNRRAELDRALRDADEAQPGPLEPILIFVPRRNVETWLLNLTGVAVDEVTNYKGDRRINQQTTTDACIALLALSRNRNQTPDNIAPSLKESLVQFDRLPDEPI